MSSIIYTPSHIKRPLDHMRRIYVSCHAGDVGLFDRISREIHDIQSDCVIAHYDYQQEYDSCHLDDVADFHLTVLPVTHRWFDSGVHQAEFEHLLRLRKTVLPILFDSECEKQFNQKTDNMQFLRIGDSNYKEKLTRNLLDILIDDELVTNIERVFTRKMFIGYCREDFEQTLKLIRYIHREESGRRIAVWFDKYLPLGINFEDSIRQELDKCTVMGITTTSNLISRENYVRYQEYRYANEQDKQIVFFDMGQTPAEDVRAFFEIGDQDEFVMVRVCDDHRFSERIKDLFGKQKKDEVPYEQDAMDYYLGQAYLNGIQVEFDSDYALKKFKASAKNGYHKSAHQLGNMYRLGIGVKRDIKQSIYWYKEEARLAEKFFSDIQRAADSLFEQLKLHPITTNDSMQSLSQFKKEYSRAFYETIRIVRFCAFTMMEEGFGKDSALFYRKALLLRDQACREYLSEREIVYGLSLENELNQLLLLRGETKSDELKRTWQQAFSLYGDLSTSDELASVLVKSGHIYVSELMTKHAFSKAMQVIGTTVEIACKYSHLTNIRELILLLCRDMGRCVLYGLKQSQGGNELRFAAGTDALKCFEKQLEIIDAYQISVYDNPYLFVTFVENEFYRAEAYTYLDDAEQAITGYLRALDKANEQVSILGELGYTADFPVVILQLYAKIFKRLKDCFEACEIDDRVIAERLSSDLGKILCRFENLGFRADHQKRSEEYIGILKDAQAYFQHPVN